MKLPSLVFLSLLLLTPISHASVDLRGLNSAQKNNVEQFLSLNALSCTTPKGEVRRLYRRANADIKQALEPFGFYNPNISSELSFGPECWNAQFDIDVGIATRLDEIHVEILGKNKNLASLTEAIPLKPNQVLHHEDYDQFRTLLLRQVRDLGYLDAVYTTHRLDIYPENNLASVFLTLDPGTQYRIGEIENNIDFLSDRLTRSLVPLKPGTAVNRRDISLIQRDLMATGFFDQVLVSSTPDSTAKLLALTINATKNDHQDFSIGAGVSSDAGIFGTLSYADQLVNKRGHQFNGNLSLGAKQKELQLEYRLPRSASLSDWYSVYLGSKQVIDDAALDSRATNLGVRFSSPRGRWRFEPFIEFSYDESNQISADNSLLSLVPGINLVYRNVSSGIRPTGIVARFELGGASRSLLSDTDFLRLYGRIKTILPTPTSARIIARGEAGYILTSQLSNIPSSWRFFSGGDTSVRGFRYRSLGPVNSRDDATGGEWVLTGSLELDMPFKENWSAAIFVDSGDVGTSGNHSTDWPIAVGAGLRWLSPLGPIRTDFAFPIQGSDARFRLHLTIGPDL